MARKGLGKGLDALIPNVVVKETAEENTTAAKEQAKTGVNDGRTIVNITKVEPNRKQPRRKFNEDDIKLILADYKNYGLTYSEIAAKHKTSLMTVQKIVKGIY